MDKIDTHFLCLKNFHDSYILYTLPGVVRRFKEKIGRNGHFVFGYRGSGNLYYISRLNESGGGAVPVWKYGLRVEGRYNNNGIIKTVERRCIFTADR